MEAAVCGRAVALPLGFWQVVPAGDAPDLPPGTHMFESHLAKEDSPAFLVRSMEDMLGRGTRKKAASAETAAETPEVEHQTY